MQAQPAVQPLRAQCQDRALQQLLGETELKHSHRTTRSGVPGSREEQTHLLALRDSTDGALGIALAAWRRDEQESQKINQAPRRSLMGNTEDTTPEDTGWDKRSRELGEQKVALPKGPRFILDRYG